VAGFETGRSTPLLTTVEQMVRALEEAGCEITDTGQISQARELGVRLRGEERARLGNTERNHHI
jgi:hypothetical protein